MKAFVIAIKDWKLSSQYGQRALRSLTQHGLEARIFDAITPKTVEEQEQKYNVRPRQRFVTTHLRDASTRPFKRACFLSHFTLWQRCIEFGEPIVIAEHDTVMTRPWDNPNFSGDVLTLNILRTRAGRVPDDSFAPAGIHTYPADFNVDAIDVVEGRELRAAQLNGAHFYIIKPEGAAKLSEIARNLGYINTDNMLNDHYVTLQYASPVYGRIDGNLYSSLGWKPSSRSKLLKLTSIKLWKMLRR